MNVVPEGKLADVARALHAAFGRSDPDAIEPMPSGVSSDLLFRIGVGGESFLLVVMPQINEINDPRRRFACMRIASDAGVAPEVRYLDVEAGISITAFVERKPLALGEARVGVARVLARLHRAASFPKEFNYVTASKTIGRFRDAQLLEEPRVSEVFRMYSRIAAVYPRVDSDMVSCHMDLRPETILFDGERIWLSDWRAAFVNDRYFDLAVAGNYLANDPEEERDYLNGYFGRAATEYEAARFFLMRQVVGLLAASVYLLLGSQGKRVDPDQLVSGFRDVHTKLWEGATDLQGEVAKVSYGLTHWFELERNMKSSRFEDALRTVSRHTAGREFSTLLTAL